MAYQNNFNGGGYNNRNGQSRNNGYQGGNNHDDRNTPKKTSADSKFEELKYKSDWITKEIDEDINTYAKEAGFFMAQKGLTSSKIRNIFGEIKRIQMATFETSKTSFYLLKPKVAYAMGRDEKNDGLKLFKLIFDRISSDVKDNNSYQNFCNIIEAILAYHKASMAELNKKDN